MLVIVLMSIASAWAASLLGDPTPAQDGRLSFNPAHHIDPVGTLAIPVMLALVGAPVFGWGKGKEIDSRWFRKPRLDSALVAFSGPLVCLFVGALAAVALAATVSAFGDDPPLAIAAYGNALLLALVQTSTLLAVFNLLPIPSFNGGRIVEALLPHKWADEFARMNQYGLLILIALVMILPLLSPQLDIIRRLVVPVSQAIALFFLWGAGLTG